MLRAKQLGFSIQELDEVDEADEALIIDMSIGSANDRESKSYARIAGQADFDSF